ncbi:hypothetical protein B0T25DRAFT_512596 [Lasiosphaeria hispida]|uniref:G-protein coupled receptors family 2 profile 2 domain-containing protein n=1 Tax=Lasiosphaeria hispida TaxID=260671 RepID=A0AAJ0HT32_9PEZI|nr:hypothetical protein B0T25DRAFT_512596 [Lasiosphaeria hispida]
MAILKIDPGVSGYMNLTTTERATIQHVERFGASLSLVGVVLIFITYALFKRLRTVPNTFILFASFANVGASTACLIGYDGIMAGDSAPLCQIQAFLLEMFMQSDPWWSLAMAVNVYLVFFFAANPNSFRRYLWLYSLICFGFPALPAFICLFYMPNGDRIYGNATLWCWIGDRYNQLRIFSYYLPIWTCSVLSALIYVAVGYHVFHQRNQLRNLTLSNQAKDISGPETRGSAEKNQAAQQNYYGTVTTEVQVTAESSSDGHTVTPPSTPAPSITPVLQIAPLSAPLHPWMSRSDDIDIEDRAYSAASTAATNAPFRTVSSISSSKVRQVPKGGQRLLFGSVRRPFRRFVVKLRHLDPIKLAYLRTSFVFAISILITWTPSSINRVYSFAHPTSTSYSLNLASAVVLPLQGVWNAVIFCATSWTVLREEMAAIRSRCFSTRGSERLPGGQLGMQQPVNTSPNRRSPGQELDPTPRMGTMRVIRGGSL